jgi:antitoxin component HigA of HigAB toxin-antitoxin module
MRQVTIITNTEMIKLIKRHMKSEGLTTAALAREIGVNYQYFHDMLAGRGPITAEVARYFKFERLDHVFTARQPREPRPRRHPQQDDPASD